VSFGSAAGDVSALDEEPWNRREAPGPAAREHASNRAEMAAGVLAALAQAAQPGERLGSKVDVREACKVSVGTFNEALKMAQARGIVLVKRGPGGGIFAAEPSPLAKLGNRMPALEEEANLVSDALRIRNSLDALVIEDALKYSSAADVAELREDIEGMRAAIEAGDVRAFLRGNWASQARVARMSPSPLLKALFLTLLDILEEHAVAFDPLLERPVPEVMEERLDHYVRMADALDARDREAAQRALLEHRQTVQPGPAR
jgi:DNA-binding FadR family transcriptional regulator